jgi:hypothetical protein
MVENQEYVVLITVAPMQRSANFLALCSFVVVLFGHFLNLSLRGCQSNKYVSQIVANSFS